MGLRQRSRLKARRKSFSPQLLCTCDEWQVTAVYNATEWPRAKTQPLAQPLSTFFVSNDCVHHYLQANKLCAVGQAPAVAWVSSVWDLAEEQVGLGGAKSSEAGMVVLSLRSSATGP
jgi:hypothetical protein